MDGQQVPVEAVPRAWRLVLWFVEVGKAAVGGAGLGIAAFGVAVLLGWADGRSERLFEDIEIYQLSAFAGAIVIAFLQIYIMKVRWWRS